MSKKIHSKFGLLVCTALASGVMSEQAMAQVSSGDESNSLQEIIVTAQKREQSVQDVPIAVTAVTQETLRA